MKKLVSILVLATALIFAGMAVSQSPENVNVRASWSPPTEGSPVVLYVLQLSVNGEQFFTYGTTEDTTMIVTVTMHNEYIARVAGIDAQDRQGPWSLPSDPYVYDPGMPGEPGQPIFSFE
jgi:hypothetical protein